MGAYAMPLAPSNTLDEALRRLLGGRSGRAAVWPANETVRCLACGAGVRRERMLGGGTIADCESCGTVLEEAPPAPERPALTLVR